MGTIFSTEALNPDAPSYESIMHLLEQYAHPGETTTFKIYLFFLKTAGTMYAWTDEKKFKRQFLEERNKDAFIVKKIKFDDVSYTVFRHNNYLSQLIENYLFDGDQYITLLSTGYENDALDESQSVISDTFELIKDAYEHRKNYFHQRILNLIFDATNIVSCNRNELGIVTEATLEINTFKLFYDLFKDTF